ncbi:MAG: 23S rRNA (uracil(1939)-C(5))-methyltransferase RlmD [Gammaproteobacteria bacterium]|nr:MAG: 23S rRNA (uracil(1939)-C(5))-methyltransferase RlmD [Gammaproteobacteria bacterium]
MSRRKPWRNKELALDIVDLTHDGRGVGRSEGKAVFVDNALPGEHVKARLKMRQRSFDIAIAEEIAQPSPDRVAPRCAHFLVCGGCALQHLDHEAQLKHKQTLLARQFEHFGGVKPERWLSPLTGPQWGYRRKARLAVKDVPGKGRVLVGFRERFSHFVAEIEQCHVLHPSVGEQLPTLAALVASLSVRQRLPQIEVAVGDEGRALIFRHLRPLTDQDCEHLIEFGKANGFDIYLQPKGPDTIHRLWPQPGPERLYYDLPDFDLRLAFHPSDFTQVNHDINRQMTRQAVELLAPRQDEVVLDLFCGLGNFSLPLATRAARVIGVEGSAAMTERAYENARLNGLTNLDFYSADLTQSFDLAGWGVSRIDKVLLDPPRSGALEVCQHLIETKPKRIVYVSCQPSTLARDAGLLVSNGYRLVAAGIMDMFPQTAHVESMAVFEREK